MHRTLPLSFALALGFVTACNAAPMEPVQVPFEDPLHLVVVEARIGGEGPFRFALDCGATLTVIDNAVADQLGLEQNSPQTGRGTAAGSVVTTSWIGGGVSFAFTEDFSVQIDRVIAAPVRESSRSMIGEQFDGILGSAFFFKYVIEVIYSERTLVFRDRGGFQYDGDGIELPLEFPSDTPALPFIRGTLINGDRSLTDYPIAVDSGGQTMGTATVGKQSQWDALLTAGSRVIPVMGATGLANSPHGNTHGAFVTRMDRLVIGPFEFDSPYIGYSSGGPGWGAIGATLLHRFTAVFDYNRKRLILDPNERIDDATPMDRSGLLLIQPPNLGGALEIFFVAPETPGSEAGLRQGDRIQSIDGVVAEDLGLNFARSLLNGEGTFRLMVVRAGESSEITLVTRDLYGG